MTNDTHHRDDEFEDDEVTLAASDDALEEIQAEAARVRAGQGKFDPSDDPTTVINLDPDLAEEPTIIRTFDPVNDPTVVTFDGSDDPTTLGFDAGDDPTTVMASAAVAPPSRPTQSKPETAAKAAPTMGSLIDGKAPPATTTNYWDRNDLAAAAPVRETSRGSIPTWFLAAVALAVLAAVAIVLAVMYLTSGSSGVSA